MAKSGVIYSRTVTDKIASKLEHLAQTPKGDTLKQMIFQLRPRIEAAQAMGHTLEEIVMLFEEDGVELTLNTLKRYLQESRAGDKVPSSTADSPEAKTDRGRGSRDKAVKQSKSGNSVNGGVTSTPVPIASVVQPALVEEEKQAPTSLTNTDASGFQTMVADEEL